MVGEEGTSIGIVGWQMENSLHGYSVQPRHDIVRATRSNAIEIIEKEVFEAFILYRIS